MPARKALIVTCWPITQGEREPGHNFTGLDEMRDHDRLVEAQRHTVEAPDVIGDRGGSGMIE
eukprot:scaffold122122_cov33-Tisochrysis_lutea.AAC.3